MGFTKLFMVYNSKCDCCIIACLTLFCFIIFPGRLFTSKATSPLRTRGAVFFLIWLPLRHSCSAEEALAVMKRQALQTKGSWVSGKLSFSSRPLGIGLLFLNLVQFKMASLKSFQFYRKENDECLC